MNIVRSGAVNCTFDKAVNQGDYVQVSTTSNGYCTVAGSTYPTSNQIIGIALSGSNSGSTGTPRPSSSTTLKFVFYNVKFVARIDSAYDLHDWSLLQFATHKQHNRMSLFDRLLRHQRRYRYSAASFNRGSDLQADECKRYRPSFLYKASIRRHYPGRARWNSN